MEEMYFQQFNVYKNIALWGTRLREEQIAATRVIPCTTALKIVDTMEGTSLEGQHLTGKKLVIIGALDTKIFIQTSPCYQIGCWMEYVIPFSTFIIVPKDICRDMPIVIDYKIEDVTIKVMAEEALFISITLSVVYRDEC